MVDKLDLTYLYLEEVVPEVAEAAVEAASVAVEEVTEAAEAEASVVVAEAEVEAEVEASEAHQSHHSSMTQVLLLDPTVSCYEQCERQSVAESKFSIIITYLLFLVALLLPLVVKRSLNKDKLNLNRPFIIAASY